jgi:hypothetical protein
MPEEQQGRSFDEYNLIFYRKCEKKNPEEKPVYSSVAA